MLTFRFLSPSLPVSDHEWATALGRPEAPRVRSEPPEPRPAHQLPAGRGELRQGQLAGPAHLPTREK